ncbi:MAG: exosortase/archaeosortase family protein [Candidatus Saccharicenans sp.]|uniref:exosortase/archaeosortase family protein n=1 Tax=Candidatus Saccharicenans sp. TaxID=2819258 RepID=UPI0040499830
MASFFLFVFFSLLALSLGFNAIKTIFSDPRINLYYSHIPFIPIISAFLIFRKRRALFGSPVPDILPGSLLAIAALSLHLFIRIKLPNSEYSIFMSVLSAILFWVGTYIALFGIKSFRQALFPAVFLLLAVPIPEAIMDKIVLLIASASVPVTGLLFSLIGLPFIREGVEFYLPVFTLVVGPECAGWRSSIAIIITSLLAGHLFLKKLSNKLILVSVALPLIIIKNGVRIVLLYIIAYYIDDRFIESGLRHRSIGYAMFLIVLILMGLLLWFLEKREAKNDPEI